MSFTTSSILSIIPPEVTEHALSLCRLKDVVAFSTTCKTAYRIVNNPPPPQLWRALFLAIFDNPHLLLARPKSSVGGVYDWKGSLIRRFRAAQLVQGKDIPSMSRKEALETFISIINEMPLSDPLADDISLNGEWIVRVLQGTKIIMTHENWSEEHQLESQLRAHVALAVDHACETSNGRKLRSAHSRLTARRNRSRTYTYDLRHYTEDNHYGPFLPGPTRKVNWVHVEALMNVVQSNIREIPHQWANEVSPPSNNLKFLRANSATGENNPADWAGVEGSWARYVSFMDYRELFAFNFTAMYGGPRNSSYFNDPSFREATRLIRLTLRLTSPDKLKFRGLADEANLDEESTDDNPPHDPRYPTLYFSGSSHGASTGNEANIEGNVRMGVDGVLLWRFVSIYDGHTQWSSEGVQLGHVNSAMGVIGVWTSDTHDEGDPAGPFWFWKPRHALDDLEVI